MPSFRRLLLAVALVFVSQMSSRAAVVYTEISRGGTDPELSSDNLSPTNLGTFMAGVNTVTGRVTDIGSTGGNFTADIFAFQIPASHSLQTIVLSSYSTQPPSTNMFLALDNGPTFEFSTLEINDNTNFPNLSLIMGAVLVGNSHIGTDILDDLANPAVNNNGIPFSRPLGPGTYTIYIQENMSFSNYSLNFNVVTAVPEPSSVLLVASIAAAVGPLAKFRRRKQVKDTL